MKNEKPSLRNDMFIFFNNHKIFSSLLFVFVAFCVAVSAKFSLNFISIIATPKSVYDLSDKFFEESWACSGVVFEGSYAKPVVTENDNGFYKIKECNDAYNTREEIGRYMWSRYGFIYRNNTYISGYIFHRSYIMEYAEYRYDMNVKLSEVRMNCRANTKI